MAFGAECRRDRLKNVTDDPAAAGPCCPAPGGADDRPRAARTKVNELSPSCACRWCRTRRSPISSSFDTGVPLLGLRRRSRPTPTSSAWTGRRSQDVRFRGSYPARGSRGEHRRAVHGAGLQPVRRAGRSVRRGPDRHGRRSLAASCIASGVPAAVFDDPAPARLDSPAGQYNFLQGGNPDLVPESRTRTPTASSSSRGSCRSWRCRSTTSTSRSTTRSRPSAPTTRCKPATSTDDPARLRPHRPRPGNGSLWHGDGHVSDLNINIGSLSDEGL